jgi:hypothetical protein
MDNMINKYWSIIGEDLQKLVKIAENKPKTTQNNYGNYLALLTQLKGELGLNMAKALLIKAGGNKAGIEDASKIF